MEVVSSSKETRGSETTTTCFTRGTAAWSAPAFEWLHNSQQITGYLGYESHAAPVTTRSRCFPYFSERRSGDSDCEATGSLEHSNLTLSVLLRLENCVFPESFNCNFCGGNGVTQRQRVRCKTFQMKNRLANSGDRPAGWANGSAQNWKRIAAPKL